MFFATELFRNNQTLLVKRQRTVVIAHFLIFVCEVVQNIPNFRVLWSQQLFANRQTTLVKQRSLGVVTHIVAQASQIAEDVGNICAAAERFLCNLQPVFYVTKRVRQFCVGIGIGIKGGPVRRGCGASTLQTEHADTHGQACGAEFSMTLTIAHVPDSAKLPANGRVCVKRCPSRRQKIKCSRFNCQLLLPRCKATMRSGPCMRLLLNLVSSRPQGSG